MLQQNPWRIDSKLFRDRLDVCQTGGGKEDVKAMVGDRKRGRGLGDTKGDITGELQRDNDRTEGGGE